MSAPATGPLLMIIGGHPRSGTTMLTYVCDTHPLIKLTFEFQSFLKLDVSYEEYRAALRTDWQNRAIAYARRGYDLRTKVKNGLFVLHFLARLYPYRSQTITLEIVRSVLHRTFPRAAVVGDKFPRYIWQMPDLAAAPGLLPVVIYRDCRDVVQSALIMAHTRWKGQPFARDLDTADKVARHWVETMNFMDEHREQLYIVRYEEMAHDPFPALAGLADRLRVSSAGFRKDTVWTSSIGKYQEKLTPEQLEIVMDIAGPTMARWGYT